MLHRPVNNRTLTQAAVLTFAMADYSNVIQVGASMLATILIAFMLVRFQLIPFSAIGHLNRFLLKCCYLPLLARAISVRNLSDIYFTPAVVGALANLAVHLLFALVFLFPLRDRFFYYVSSVLPTVYINYLIVGIPVFNAIWPESENVVIAVMTLSNDVVCVPSFLIFSKIYEQYRRNRDPTRSDAGEGFTAKLCGQIVLRVVLNPIMLGNVVGYIYAATGWKMCPFLWDLMKYTADSVLALSLFCVGGFLSQHSLIACHWLHFLICVFSRHIVFPGIVALLSMAFKLTGRLTRQCVLMACNPSATACYILAADAKLGQGVASTMIFWTTLVCVPLQVLWLFVFDSFNLFPDEGPLN